MQRGNSKAAGKPDSRVRDLLGTWEGELAGPALRRAWGGGSLLPTGTSKGPFSLGSPGPLSGQFPGLASRGRTASSFSRSWDVAGAA